MMAKEKSQSQKFVDKARELGCEDNEQAFDEALRKVAAHKPKDVKGEKLKRDRK